MNAETMRVRVREAMGWRIHRWTRGQHSYTHWMSPGELKPDTCSDAFRQRLGVPNYPADLNAAITLCDRLAEEGWGCELSQGTDKTWECTFSRPERLASNPKSLGKCLESHYHAADTLPEAICGCFLKCKGLWEEGE